jgi:ketosteroid isomerase-like protein
VHLDDQFEVLGAIGTGVMADIARHLEAAYGDLDVELLGSFLHPQVRWTGACSNREQVLDWYRGLLADGIQSTVETVEVDGDAVLLGLSLARQAVGALPEPSEHLCQVFTVKDAQITEVRVYPDRASALGDVTVGG